MTGILQIELSEITTACNSWKRDCNDISTVGGNSSRDTSAIPALPGQEQPMSLTSTEVTRTLPFESDLPVSKIAGGRSERKQSPEQWKADEPNSSRNLVFSDMRVSKGKKQRSLNSNLGVKLQNLNHGKSHFAAK